MKKIAIIIIFLFPIFVFAHTTFENANMTVLMHVSPDDNPIAKIPTNIFFYFTDSRKIFNLSDCDCLLVVSLGNQKILSEKMQSSSATVTLPRKAVYQVEIFAKSKTKKFADFLVHYDLRVEREAKSKWLEFVEKYQIPLILIGLVVLFETLSIKRKKRL